MIRFSIRSSILAIAVAVAPVITAGCAHANSGPAAAERAEGSYEWVTLGTMGGPMPSATRAEPANLLVRNGSAHLVDVGDGAATAMVVAGADFRELRSIWISHIHFDHIGGLFGALGLRLQTRGTEPLTVYGPPGTRAIIDGLIAAMQPSARSGFGVPGEVPIDPGASITVVELDDGDVVTLDDFTVRVASNTHYSFPPGSDNERDFRSLSFRFDLPERSIVYTGDTGSSDKVTALAQGADMLVTELIDVEATIANLRHRAAQLSPEEAANMERHLREHHVTTTDIGMMAGAAGVGEVVVTHLAGGGAVREPGAADRYVREIGSHFSGRVRVANDQDRF